MLRINQLTGFNASGGYEANAVEFDGTNDYLTKATDFSGNADSKLLTFSVWFANDNAAGIRNIIDTDLGYVKIDHAVNDTLRVYAENSSGTRILQIDTSTVLDSNWHHLLCSVDLSDTGKRHLYLDDVSDLAVNTYTNDTIDFTRSSYNVGVADGEVVQKWDGGMADLWFDPGTYIDFSVETNRRKFVSAIVKPVFLGGSGETPTGSSPLLFLSGPTAAWHTNKGTGLGMTENGELTTDGTSPSD